MLIPIPSSLLPLRTMSIALVVQGERAKLDRLSRSLPSTTNRIPESMYTVDLPRFEFTLTRCV